jgi:hypothetical protein
MADIYVALDTVRGGRPELVRRPFGKCEIQRPGAHFIVLLVFDELHRARATPRVETVSEGSVSLVVTDIYATLDTVRGGHPEPVRRPFGKGEIQRPGALLIVLLVFDELHRAGATPRAQTMTGCLHGRRDAARRRLCGCHRLRGWHRLARQSLATFGELAHAPIRLVGAHLIMVQYLALGDLAGHVFHGGRPSKTCRRSVYPRSGRTDNGRFSTSVYPRSVDPRSKTNKIPLV